MSIIFEITPPSLFLTGLFETNFKSWKELSPGSRSLWWKAAWEPSRRRIKWCCAYEFVACYLVSSALCKAALCMSWRMESSLPRSHVSFLQVLFLLSCICFYHVQLNQISRYVSLSLSTMLLFHFICQHCPERAGSWQGHRFCILHKTSVSDCYTFSTRL